MTSSPHTARRVRVVDSHTGGEPTRVVLGGAPDLGPGPLAERALRLGEEHLDFLRAVVCEPRGSDAMVGALRVEPDDAGADAAVIFFNDAGPLGMCGHGTIGLVETLRYVGGAGAPATGTFTIETPVGLVRAERTPDGRVRVANVASRRTRAGVELDVPGLGRVVGDVAWGGNWFFLASTPPGLPIAAPHVLELGLRARAVRRALADAGVRGDDGAWIDHVEFFGPPENPENDSRNFVLCPGGAFDRSPCGTGTSAKLACLAADGKLQPGVAWRQESVVGSVFEATYEPGPEGSVLPTIAGSAHVTLEAELVLDRNDPFQSGIPGLAGAPEDSNA
ncbi:MAG: proline racemase family protein [Planctomycetota bacterium]